MGKENLTVLNGGTKPEELISDALRMLSACALQHVCPGRARQVICQLETIAESASVSPLLRQTCEFLLNAWRESTRRFQKQMEEEEYLRNLH